MCELKQVHYECGHNRKVLRNLCRTAKMMGAPPTRAPDYCVNGRKVAEVVQSSGDCGRGGEGFSCSETKVLEPLTKKYEDMQAQISDYAQRVTDIKTCAITDRMPEYDWHAVAMSGLNVAEQRERVRYSRHEVIPKLVGEMRDLFARAGPALANAYRENAIRIVNELKNSGDQVSQEADSESSEDSEDAMYEWMTYPILERTFDRFETDMNGTMEVLEFAAAQSGLDAVGWVVPPSAVIVVVNRLVHPVNYKPPQESF